MATHANPLLPLAAPKRTGRVDYGFLLYFGLHMAGFLATTLLMTWGLFVLFFLVLAVPTYVAVSSDFDLCSGLNCRTAVPAHDRITGNVSVRYVLDTFVSARGPGAGVASVALRNMAKAS